jgi:uncharacterized membrane protein HdeD (DUF308 family)
MTSDNQDPGKKPDPAYQGAKPASFSDMPQDYGFFGPAGLFTPSHAMSALLAQNWWVVALRGVFTLLFGVIAILLPGVTLAALALLFAAYMLVDGILAIVAGLRAAQRHERWGMLVLEGIIDIAAGVIVFLWPLISIIVFVYLMGAWAVISGALELFAAFRLNVAPGRWLMVLSGAVSVLWGLLLLLIHPLAGAMVITWWMGAYALFFGGALLGLAFRLRRLRDQMPRSGAVPQGT